MNTWTNSIKLFTLLVSAFLFSCTTTDGLKVTETNIGSSSSKRVLPIEHRTPVSNKEMKKEETVEKPSTLRTKQSKVPDKTLSYPEILKPSATLSPSEKAIPEQTRKSPYIDSNIKDPSLRGSEKNSEPPNNPRYKNDKLGENSVNKSAQELQDKEKTSSPSKLTYEEDNINASLDELNATTPKTSSNRKERDLITENFESISKPLPTPSINKESEKIDNGEDSENKEMTEPPQNKDVRWKLRWSNDRGK